MKPRSASWLQEARFVSRVLSKATAVNKALRIEISTLKSPKRLELIATGQLGLSAPKPEQVVYLWLDD